MKTLEFERFKGRTLDLLQQIFFYLNNKLLTTLPEPGLREFMPSINERSSP